MRALAAFMRGDPACGCSEGSQIMYLGGCIALPLPSPDNMGVDVDLLRTETRAEHESVEALLPLMDRGLTRERYADVLECLYGIVRSWEDWAAAHAPAGLAGTVRERRRAALLQADLLAMNKDAQDAPAPGTGWSDAFPDREKQPGEFEAAFLGAMYVMEGSTLGGQFIARHVEVNLELAPGMGDAYFRSYGEHTGSMWQQFKALLSAVPDQNAEIVIQAAKAMFAFYGDALRTCPAIHAAPSLP